MTSDRFTYHKRTTSSTSSESYSITTQHQSTAAASDTSSFQQQDDEYPRSRTAELLRVDAMDYCYDSTHVSTLFHDGMMLDSSPSEHSESPSSGGWGFFPESEAEPSTSSRKSALASRRSSRLLLLEEEEVVEDAFTRHAYYRPAWSDCRSETTNRCKTQSVINKFPPFEVIAATWIIMGPPETSSNSRAI